MATKASLATVSAQFADTASRRGSHVAIRTRDGRVSWTWEDYAERACRAASALEDVGVRRGDTVAIWLRNRPAANIADAATMLLGAISAPIHISANLEHAAHVVVDSGARVLITEPAFLGAALEIRADHRADLWHIVLVGGSGPEALNWEDLLAATDIRHDLATAADAARVSDVLTTVYTAGTSAPPKGVDLTHANIAAQVEALITALQLGRDLSAVSGLPAATVTERLCAQYLPIRLGWEVTCCPQPSLAAAFIREVSPTFVCASPHTWRALRGSFMANVRDTDDLGALGPRPAGRGRFERDDRRASPSLARLRAAAGLDRLEHSLVASGHCHPEVLTFFRSIGIPLTPCYDVTETAGVAAVGRPGSETTGQSVAGTELRLSPEGEILLRGPSTAASYRAGPRDRRACADPYGWVATGDLGVVDDRGDLQVLDRLDALVRTSSGRVVAPARLEAALVFTSSLVSNAFVTGDGRPHVVALLTLDLDGARYWARDHGIRPKDLGALAGDPDVLGAVAGSVAQVNRRLDEPDRIRRFLLLAAPWAIGDEEITHTHSLRRHVIARKYAPEIEALYEGHGVEPTPL